MNLIDACIDSKIKRVVALSTDNENHFKILLSIHQWSSDPSRINGGIKVDEGFMYTSDNNSEWMQIEKLQSWIKRHQEKIRTI